MYGKNESDSNADTYCLDKNFVVIDYTHRSADVYPYEKSYEPIVNVLIISGVTAYNDPHTGSTWLSIINEGLYSSNKLDHTLINPTS